ncbi:MAG: metal ABC transporter solute-binding protein, Zn/Mn family [Brevinematia bacterium]
MFRVLLFLVFLAGNLIFSLDKPIIIVSILPQHEFVTRISGEKVKVVTLAGVGASPHDYEPSPLQMAEIGKASAYFTINVEFERGILPKIKSLYPSLRIYDTAKNVEYRNIESHSDEKENHKKEIIDPHIWLGYKQVKTMLSNILEALIEITPENASFYRKNYKAYISEIDRTFSALSNKLSPHRGKTIFVFHPAFGYLFDSFGLKQESIELGGKEPSQKHIVEIVKKAKKENVKIIFVQKQFSKIAAEKIAKAIDGKIVEIDPLAQNWLENINYIGNTISEALK